MIHFVDEQGGPLSTIAEIIDKPILIDKDEPKRYVKISAAYSQMLWMICSIVMRNHDSVAINYEIEQMSIEEHKSFLRELEIDNTITKYMFYFYDIVKEESTKFAGLMCHLFYAWAVYTHDDNMPHWDGPYEETIEKIRNYMSEKISH